MEDCLFITFHTYTQSVVCCFRFFFKYGFVYHRVDGSSEGMNPNLVSFMIHIFLEFPFIVFNKSTHYTRRSALYFRIVITHTYCRYRVPFIHQSYRAQRLPAHVPINTTAKKGVCGRRNKF